MDYQVLYCGKHGPTWQRGVVTKKERFVKVETLEGTNMFRLFDHVNVGIQLRGQALSLKSYTLKLTISLQETTLMPIHFPTVFLITSLGKEMTAVLDQAR